MYYTVVGHVNLIDHNLSSQKLYVLVISMGSTIYNTMVIFKTIVNQQMVLPELFHTFGCY